MRIQPAGFVIGSLGHICITGELYFKSVTEPSAVVVRFLTQEYVFMRPTG